MRGKTPSLWFGACLLCVSLIKTAFHAFHLYNEEVRQNGKKNNLTA